MERPHSSSRFYRLLPVEWGRLQVAARIKVYRPSHLRIDGKAG